MDTVDEQQLQATLATLFPPEVATSALLSLPENAVLLPAEEPGTQDMVASRRHEFTLGRHCARLAMQSLGANPLAVPRTPDRAPVWPVGLTGSISHSGKAVMAAIGHSASYSGIGLDIESTEPLSKDVTKLICRAEESPADAKLLFGIKEAVYKCIYPTVKTYVDFQEMEIKLDKAQSSYRAISHCEKFDPRIVNRLMGRYYNDVGYVICSAWIPV